MMKLRLTLIILFSSLVAFSQQKITLQNCYSLLNKNYPLAKQSELLEHQQQIENQVIEIGKLPKFDFLAQSTYQSDVTFLPVSVPTLSVQPPNKDQYKTTVSVNQLIYNSGLIEASKKLKQSEFDTKKQQIEVNLYQLKNKVNQHYFTILLLQEQLQLLASKENLLKAKLSEVNSGIKYGAILPSANQLLEAELLKIKQQIITLKSNRSYLTTSLSTLIGNPISENTLFETPVINSTFDSSLKRPEITLFQLQKEQINASKILLTKQNAPKLVGFATGGYGNPGLNMLDNAFKPFYIVGVKLNWTVFDWNRVKKQQQSLEISKHIIDNQQEVFSLNTSLEIQQQQTEISKLNQFIASDKEIITLREKVLQTANSQLKNGSITTAAYLTEFTNLFEAKNNLKLHHIQLLLAKAAYNTTTGN